jgi:sulfur carrier protein
MEPVKIVLRDQEYEVKGGMTLREALAKLGINRESVLATRQGELITDDEILRPGETIRLVAVISGGSADNLWL